MYDLIIIGGGPAGLTAAMYAIRKRLKALLVSHDLGGKTNYHLELPEQESHSTINGVEVIERFRSELEYLRFARHMELVDRVERRDDHFVVHTRGGGELQARAVIVATGARQQRLGVPGEKEYLSRGLCYSALSYAPLFIDKETIVIGRGELALRSAAELSTVARRVTVVGPSGAILNTPLGAKLVAADHVTVLSDYVVEEIQGDGYCRGVRVRSPAGETMDIPADGTFIEEELQANAEPVAGLVELDERGFIKIDAYCRTSLPGLFAAGDVTNVYAEQVLVAVGEGVKAILSAYDYLLPSLKL